MTPQTPQSHQAAPIAALKRGEYIRLKDTPTAPVWVRGDFDRTSGTYELQAFDDANRFAYRKGTTVVFHGFTF